MGSCYLLGRQSIKTESYAIFLSCQAHAEAAARLVASMLRYDRYDIVVSNEIVLYRHRMCGPTSSHLLLA